MRRVVITGMGLVSPLGSSPGKLWEGLASGKSGVRELTSVPVEALPTRYGAECRDFTGAIDDFGPLEKTMQRTIKKGLKVMCREMQLGIAVAQLALHDSGLPLGEHYENRLKLVEAYDRLGIRTYHLAEHHATPLGMAPSPSVFLAAVAQRTREIGIRLALGAARTGVVSMIVRQAVLLAAAGLGIGLTLAFGASRLIAGLLFATEPGDPLTYAAVAAGLLLVAMAASYLPARRASRIDPIRALRFD